MALVLRDRVKETTTTTGTGTVTLAGAVSGFQSFSVIGNANTTYYAIVGQTTTEWEVGIGTYTAVGTTLSRDTVLESSNGGTAVNFSAGTKDVFCTYPAERAVSTADLGTIASQAANNVAITGGSITGITDLAVADGGTGASTAADARTNLGAATSGANSDITSLTGLSGNLSFTGTGNRITGDFSNATFSNRVLFQTSTTNAQTVIEAIPNGTSLNSRFVASSSSSDPANSSIFDLGILNATDARLSSSIRGTGTYLPMTFYTGGSERMRIDTSGNVSIATDTARAQVHVIGASAGQTTAALTDAGSRAGMIRTSDNNSATGSGGAILFSNSQGDTANSVGFAAIKGLLTDGSNNTSGGLAFSTRQNATDVALTERFRISNSGALGIGGANYGTAGQVLTSGGSGAAPTWSAGSIGVGQTWQDVTASRAKSTAYTNSTGKPIQVIITVNNASALATITVGGVSFTLGSTGTTGGVGFSSFIVPNGISYSVTFAGSLNKWLELR